MSFLQSKRLGDEGEVFVQALLQCAGIKCEINPNSREKYDLICELDKKFTIECKYDLLSATTKNIAIEVYNTKSKQASGLQVTKANLWSLISKKDKKLVAYLTKTSLLRQFIKKYKPKKRILKAGDNNSSILLYSDYFIINKIFKRIDNMKEQELKSLLKEWI